MIELVKLGIELPPARPLCRDRLQSVVFVYTKTLLLRFELLQAAACVAARDLVLASLDWIGFNCQQSIL